MPYCKVCGNRRTFGSSRVPPASPFANGPSSGIVADFNSDDKISMVSSMGVDKNTLNAATRDPEEYFDTCLYCGNQNLEWTVNDAANKTRN